MVNAFARANAGCGQECVKLSQQESFFSSTDLSCACATSYMVPACGFDILSCDVCRCCCVVVVLLLPLAFPMFFSPKTCPFLLLWWLGRATTALQRLRVFLCHGDRASQQRHYQNDG